MKELEIRNRTRRLIPSLIVHISTPAFECPCRNLPKHFHVIGPILPEPNQVRDAVKEVLDNPVYRDNAKRIQDDFAMYDAPTRAAELLEALASGQLGWWHYQMCARSLFNPAEQDLSRRRSLG